MLDISLEAYKIFYYVAKCRGITIAARELCVSQPAVSQAIKQLEERLGVSLFIRTAKGVKLTKEGEVLFASVSSGYEQILHGEEKLRKMLDVESGEVRIGASDMTLRFYLLPYLEHFHHMYPNIKVKVTNAPTPETFEHLYAGRIDFGVVSEPFAEHKNLKITKAREVEDIFIAGRKFWRLKNKMLSYKNLESLPIICLENNTSTRMYVDQFLKENDVVLKPEFELATSDVIVQFALRNLGIGCVMSDFAEPYLEDGSLFELHFDKRIPRRKLCVVNNEAEPMSVAATKLIELMRV